ncbi:hypothetical protein Esi_0002_0275 [Ectocarpus siliculosus]|uniref:Uncharacterized protein n=1 Tax=Ectocarpus siliculosus TaxID=2880 RepID=D7FQC1_ECTSI|nr:hypothetical protein Esi_0002_0275 [Ectocarpus siliculosus]|eukprot:CBJ48453.1 hypothetical protein Esi_0002_0275 [Ectocarpus siliculosus]
MVSRSSAVSFEKELSGKLAAESTDSHGHGSDEKALHPHGQVAGIVDDGSDRPDVGECILLFGVVHRGNMGERAQTASMEHLLASVAPPSQCFWHSLLWDENRAVQGQSTAKLYDDDNSHSIPFTADYLDELNKFKALVVGDGGIFNAKLRHAPAEVNTLLERLTLPIVMMSASSSKAKPRSDVLLHTAVFEPGRDAVSRRVLSSMLRRGEALVRPGDIAVVRGPVLSDETLTDTEGTCWKQSEGEHQQPLCFILPASITQTNVEMHQQLLGHVVRRGDVFINVFQEHQRAIEEHDYPGEILQILDPTEFMGRLCSCRAIVSTRLDGALLGLHMGVPTFGAFGSKVRNDEVRELMVDIMHLPEHYIAIDETLTREAVDLQVETVRRAYADQNRRALIHARLSAFSEDFRRQARDALFDIVGVQEQEQQENDNQDAKRQTQKALATATGISIKAAKTSSVPRAAERLVILSMLPSADETDESTRLGVVPENSPTVDTAVKPGVLSLAAVSRSKTHASKRVLYSVARPTIREEMEVSESQVLISHHRGRAEPPSVGPGTIVSDTLSGKSEESADHDLVREAGLPISTSGAASGLGVLTATGESVSMPMPTISRLSVAEATGGTSSVKLFKDDYVAVMLFILLIVGLALLPPRRLPGRQCHGKLVAATTAGFVGQDSIDMELGSCTSSDSELSVVSEWTLPSPVRSTTVANSVDATSSVIFLVLNFTIWVFLAVGFSGYCMAYLSHTHDPVGLLTLQGATGVAILLLLGLFAGLDFNFNPRLGLTPAANCQVGCAAARQTRLAALLHAGQTLLANAAVLVGGVDATNALSAATEPVAATVLSYLLLGKTYSGLRLTALTTIVAGTLFLVFERKSDQGGGSSGSSGSNSLAVLTMTAVCFSALRNVAIKGSPVPPPHQTLLACSVAATVVGVGLMLVRIICRRMDFLQRTGPGPDSALRIIESGGGDGISNNHEFSTSWLRMDGVNAALCVVGCNLASFNLLARLSLIDHAIGSSCKRMLVFAGELFVLGKVMSVSQLGGTVVTFFGVLAFNIAGIGENRFTRGCKSCVGE